MRVLGAVLALTGIPMTLSLGPADERPATPVSVGASATVPADRALGSAPYRTTGIRSRPWLVGSLQVGVCHITGNGGYLRINVNAAALPAHFGHGDVLAGTNGLGPDCAPSNRRYISFDPQTCLVIRWFCPEGSFLFSDETGCGCELDP